MLRSVSCFGIIDIKRIMRWLNDSFTPIAVEKLKSTDDFGAQGSAAFLQIVMVVP
jgi:hypothetical protein